MLPSSYSLIRAALTACETKLPSKSGAPKRAVAYPTWPPQGALSDLSGTDLQLLVRSGESAPLALAESGENYEKRDLSV